MSLTLQHASLITMLAVCLAALLLAGIFYRRSYGWLRPTQWRLLFTLRALAILLIVLLLFRPVLSFQRQITQKRVLVFLVDASASMGIADDSGPTTRFAQARGRVLDWWSRCAPDFDMHLLTFAAGVRPAESVGELAELRPSGKATSLSRALEAATKTAPPADFEAVLLFSDGVHNSTGNPVEVARQSGVVVHTIGTGSSLRDGPSYRDIRVTELECPEQLSLDNRAELTAYVDAVGFAGRVVTVVLEQDATPVEQAELVLDGAQGPQAVPLQFVPSAKGRHRYTARVEPASEEKIAENNHRSAFGMVVDARIRVLYIEGTLRSEYGALVDRFLAKDPDIEFCALVQTRPNVFLRRTNMEDLPTDGIPASKEVFERFDVFVLGDLDSTYLKPAQMELLGDRVQEGAGVLMIGGYHSFGPGGYAGTRVEEVLPVFVGDRRTGQITEPFLPQLTPDGRRHPIFANVTQFFPTQSAGPQAEGLPPLEGCARVAGTKPGATVLAVHPSQAARRAGANEATAASVVPMPVLAVQPVGRGRSAAFTGDTTRNWQQAPRALDQDSPFLQFWGQLIRWLAGRADPVDINAAVVANTDKGYYEPGSVVTITAQVRDERGEGTAQAAVTALVNGPDGSDELVTLSPVAGHAGHYRGALESSNSGTYEVLVEAHLTADSQIVSSAPATDSPTEQERAETVLTAEKLLVEVGRPNLEFDRLELDERMLADIAGATGGRFLHVSAADRLLDQLERKRQSRSIYWELPLYQPPAFWLLFVSVLTVEWVLRKRFRLR